ncbi:hypothetical protein [Xanthomonas translucens]|uniref:Conserved hypothetical membrane protein n=1 Tax=Xanthomonas translucens pv. translucens DSM 18974 TaxID=1261556 RepID=A0A1C3TJ67_XANCT|nr:hypothetical protein [Xanthomonas translucens]MCC8446387.1 hypothetical protein [Xanthomonas translucens pv. translucens]UKE51250.1 hypothetical protein KCU57_02380 [Xanthomonas translucens]CCP41917.1 Protein csk22 [Xanthomonas translucens pv. translucens DSM 18974]SCB03276.1 Conserved hypothetical membrane protein [Xanthomonas translucens pv. translucens DSM 18974]
MATTGIALLAPYLATAGIGWLYYRRIRRYFGPQPWQPRRPLVRLLVLAAAGLSYLAAVLPPVRLGIGLGMLAGAALGVLALQHTDIELRHGKRYYTPNPWIGAGLGVLLIGRLAWGWASGAFSGGSAQSLRNASPLTLAIAAVLIAYSLVHTGGLLPRMRALAPPQAS